MDNREERAKEIGETNASAALDQGEAYPDEPYTSTAAYLVNTVDTAREYRVNAETAVQYFLDAIEEEVNQER